MVETFNNAKVSFDFDSTLDRGDVQHFVKRIIEEFGVDVWVVTSRVPDHKAPSDNWNNDLWFVCEQLGIPKERVIFTSFSSKHEFFWDKDFVFHLDDDVDEIHNIASLCDITIAVDVNSETWKQEIMYMLTILET